MNRDYKLNKSELTRLKREEKLYSQYLPVLKLKQEQLQLLENRIKRSIKEAKDKKDELYKKIEPFIKCFADKTSISIADAVQIKEIKTYKKNIAGVSVYALDSLTFKTIDIPFIQTAPWLLRCLAPLRDYLHSYVAVKLLEQEKAIIKRELKKAIQKVNLFELVLIKNTKDAIKRIKIALSDEQVASVSRGKIAKQKGLDAEGA